AAIVLPAQPPVHPGAGEGPGGEVASGTRGADRARLPPRAGPTARKRGARGRRGVLCRRGRRWSNPGTVLPREAEPQRGGVRRVTDPGPCRGRSPEANAGQEEVERDQEQEPAHTEHEDCL